MRLSPHLLLFMCVLPLTRAQTANPISASTTSAPTTSPPTTSPLTETAPTTSVSTTPAAPEIFYPFGWAAGDTINPAADDGSSSVIQLLSPFLFFGRTYQQIYVNNNGHLTFNQPSSVNTPYSFPARGSQDIIAGLWTNLDNSVKGFVSYHQYTSGNVLTRATRDINTHFPNLNFTASWVFVATWRNVTNFNLTSTETSFQVVLISGSNYSFILMNYGDIAVTGHPVQAGYDTVNSTQYFVIPGSINGSFISNLRNSSNVNVPGQWAFRVDGERNISKAIAQTTNAPTTSLTTQAAALTIFYPFGSAAGDTERFINYNESYDYVALSTPFSFFGRTYNHTYVNSNGLLTFNRALPGAQPYPFPTYGTEDYIAPLWTDLNDFGMGVYSYQQYTNGSVLTRATQDINRYFPQRAFTASWVLVATWDFVQTRNTSLFISHSAPAITFQVILISGGGFSFVLMNYGDCVAISFPVEAGYDTVNSTNFFQIHYSTNGSSIPVLKNTTNIDLPGRWAFLVNSGSAPEIFYPFGSSEDRRNAAVDDGGSSVIQLHSLLSPFLFFGRTYRQIYVNNNGHLTFDQSSSQFVPYPFPANGRQDIIAGLWTDLDNRVRGVVSHRQYTSGNVLTRATRDINTHFPNLNFTASWVFVATWEKVAYFSLTSTETSFQVVLISGSNYSFILMNYGDIAVTGHPVEAGYDTINSTHYFVIPGSNNGSSISNLRNSSNVNVPGRWAFRVDSGSRSNKVNIIGLKAKLSSFSDLTDTGNSQIILQQIKQELVKYGLPNSVELKLRKAEKINP